MRIYFLSILLIFSLPSFAQEFDLVGKWKSHEEKTLASMAKDGDITEQARELFENKFYGKLQIIYTKNEYRAYFPGETDDLEEFDQYYPYEVISKNDNYIEVKNFSALFNEYEISKLYIEGNCYYEFDSKLQFREYFCRIE